MRYGLAADGVAETTSLQSDQKKQEEFVKQFNIDMTENNIVEKDNYHAEMKANKGNK